MDFATFATIVKKYAKNPRMANDNLVNQLLSPIIYTYDIQNKNGESLYLSKARVSEIMNHKADIPTAIKKYWVEIQFCLIFLTKWVSLLRSVSTGEEQIN